MKKILPVIICFIIFIISCSEKKSNGIKKNENIGINQSNTVEIYNIDLDKILTEKSYLYKLHKFPFISEDADLDFQGHLPVHFYQSIKFDFKAKELRNVDFWKLKIYPYSIDIIYVRPIWIENFKRVNNNLLDSLCFSFNISKREENILLWWIKNGGILWLETGIYATGFEYIKRDGTINIPKIKNKLIELTKGLKFFDYNVNTKIYITNKYPYSSSLTSSEKYLYFNNLFSKNKFFKDIKKLKLTLKYPIESFFILNTNGLLTYKKQPLLNILKYGKGLIIFLYPFDYIDANYDGELLRWKLLELIDSYYFKLNKSPKKKEKEKNKK